MLSADCLGRTRRGSPSVRLIFAIDRLGLSPTPFVQEIFRWRRGAHRALNQEAELRRVLDDGRPPLDKARSERSLWKIIVGRKNWIFYCSGARAERAAAISTIIASCRLHSIEPQKYPDEVPAATTVVAAR